MGDKYAGGRYKKFWSNQMLSVRQFAQNFCPILGNSPASRQHNADGILEGVYDGFRKEYCPDKADGIGKSAMFAEGYRRGNQRAIDALVASGQMTPEELDSFYHGGVTETQYREYLSANDVELEMTEMGWASQGY